MAPFCADVSCATVARVNVAPPSVERSATIDPFSAPSSV